MTTDHAYMHINQGALTQTQLKEYDQNGYLIIENIVPHHVCDALMERANQLVNAADLLSTQTIFSTKTNQHVKNNYFLESGNKIHFFLEEKAINDEGNLLHEKSHIVNKIGHALHELDPLFFCFSHSHSIITIAEALMIHDPVILQSMYIFKQPHIGGEVNCHQDATYLHLKNHTITGFWFALEDATLENGCLWGMPGQHKSKLKSRMIRSKDDTITFEHHDTTPFDQCTMVPLPVKKGSMIVLHGLFPHMSHENISAQSRHAYAIHLASKNADFSEDNWIRRR